MKFALKFILGIAFCCTIAISCNSDDTAARQFVERISSGLATNDTDSIKALYPSATEVEKAGNYKFLVRLLDNEEAKYKDLGDGLWRVSFGDSLKVNIVEGEEDGQFTVKESFGFIDFGQDRLAFARATGWIDKDMSDVQIAERLSDTKFVEWVGKEFLPELKKNVSVKKTGTFGDIKEGGTWVCSDGINVTVTNRNDFDIPSDAYLIECSDWSRSHPRDTSVVAAGGDDLRAHGKMTSSVDILTTMESSSKQVIVWDDEVLLNLVYKHYKAKGNEYKRYKK